MGRGRIERQEVGKWGGVGGAGIWMDAPPRIKAENQRRGEMRKTKAHQMWLGEGDAQIALEVKGEVRKKRPEREEGLGGEEGEGGGKTNCLPPPF